MPHLTGVFEEFPELDKISITQVSSHLKQKPDIHYLTNFLGNRVLYPQTVPMDGKELEVDLALLIEGLKQKPSIVYEAETQRIIIPGYFTERFPPLKRLISAVIEAINPPGVTLLYVKEKNKTTLLGSIIKPSQVVKEFKEKGKVLVEVNGQKSQLNINSVSVTPFIGLEAEIKIGNNEYKVSGGEMGIIVDLRTGDEK